MSYERDMSNEEIIIKRLDTVIDLLQELLDVDRMGLENQNSARKITEENQIVALKLIPIFKEE